MMSYVHLHFATQAPDVFAPIQAIIVDIFGRSSVPLLSVISGILMTAFFAKRSWMDGIKNRFLTLIVPMMAWNAVAVALFWPADLSGNSIISLTGKPELIYMAFLRDLFVLACLSPLLIKAVCRAPWLTATLVLAYYLANPETVILLRPQIAGFYMVGLFVAAHGAVRLPKVSVLVAFAAVIVAEVIYTPSSDLYDLAILRPVTAAAFWIFAGWATCLPNMGRSAFAFFLAHGILFHFAGAVYARAGLLDAYALLWLLTPPMLFFVTAGALKMWNVWRNRAPSPVRVFVEIFV